MFGKGFESHSLHQGNAGFRALMSEGMTTPPNQRTSSRSGPRGPGRFALARNRAPHRPASYPKSAKASICCVGNGFGNRTRRHRIAQMRRGDTR